MTLSQKENNVYFVYLFDIFWYYILIHPIQHLILICSCCLCNPSFTPIDFMYLATRHSQRSVVDHCWRAVAVGWREGSWLVCVVWYLEWDGSVSRVGYELVDTCACITCDMYVHKDFGAFILSCSSLDRQESLNGFGTQLMS